MSTLQHNFSAYENDDTICICDDDELYVHWTKTCSFFLYTAITLLVVSAIAAVYFSYQHSTETFVFTLIGGGFLGFLCLMCIIEGFKFKKNGRYVTAFGMFDKTPGRLSDFLFMRKTFLEQQELPTHEICRRFNLLLNDKSQKDDIEEVLILAGDTMQLLTKDPRKISRETAQNVLDESAAAVMSTICNDNRRWKSDREKNAERVEQVRSMKFVEQARLAEQERQKIGAGCDY